MQGSEGFFNISMWISYSLTFRKAIVEDYLLLSRIRVAILVSGHVDPVHGRVALASHVAHVHVIGPHLFGGSGCEVSKLNWNLKCLTKGFTTFELVCDSEVV